MTTSRTQFSLVVHIGPLVRLQAQRLWGERKVVISIVEEGRASKHISVELDEADSMELARFLATVEKGRFPPPLAIPDDDDDDNL